MRCSAWMIAAMLVLCASPAWAGKPRCGDGVGQKSEACDGADLRGSTCVSLGFSGGTLSCTGACALDTSGCITSAAPVCGDGVVNGFEECDGAVDGACPGLCSAHCACPASAPTGKLEVHMVNVGQGDGLVVISPEGFVMVVDAGTNSQAAAVNAYLAGIGIFGVDYTVVSHMDADHVGGLDGVIASHPETVACFDHGGSVTTNEYGDYISAIGARRTAVMAGQTIDLGPSVRVDVLHAHMGSTNENDNSVVLRVSFGDTSVLLGGDCEAACEAMLSPGPTQIYKVHHHGSQSSSSTALLSEMRPFTALISAGVANQYGHPHQETLSALASYEIAVYGTYAVGNIAVISDGTSYTVNSGPVCSAGQTRTCGTSNIGACRTGTVDCDGAMWGTVCSGAIEPTAEVCTNGVDDDCDGLTDSDDADCSAGADHVVIAQVAYDTPGTDAIEEFVDLYNPGAAARDISGWQLSDGAGAWTIPAGTSIAAGAWLTIAKDAAGFAALHGKQPDIVGMTLSLNNGGDQLMLRDTTGAAVDFVAWESFVVGWTIAASIGDSIERSDPGVDGDTVADWAVTSPAAPRGGAATPPPPPGDCGDGVCASGEDCVSCPGDCIGRTGGKPNKRFCCGNGMCEAVGESATTCAIDCNS